MSGLAQPLDQYDSLIREVIWGKVVRDQVGRESALMTMARKERVTPWDGGQSRTEPFAYGVAQAGAVAPGSTYEYSDDQFISSWRHVVREYRAGVADYLENIAIIYQDPGAKYNILSLKCEHALRGISLQSAVAMYKDGQSVTDLNSVAQDRTLEQNGLDEVMGDGLAPGWQGKIFTNLYGVTKSSYGDTQGRTSVWLNNTDGSPGPLTYNAMSERYHDLERNGRAPTHGFTSKHGFAMAEGAIYERMRTNYIGATDVNWGIEGIKFKNMIVFVDELCPSAKYGDEIAVPSQSYKTGTFPNPAGMLKKSGSLARIPTSTSIVVGEVMFMICMPMWDWLLTTAEYFAFGMSPFQKQFGSNLVAADIHAVLNWICHDPTTSGLLAGFGEDFS